MAHSYVVTGGGRGIGRAITERLVAGGAEAGGAQAGGAQAGGAQAGGATVVVVERDPAALNWIAGHPAGRRIVAVEGDAGDEEVAGRAAERAEQAAPLAGWVNNAAVFRDVQVHDAPARDVLEVVALNLGPAVAGSAVAVRHFLARGEGGAVVNVSSHQAQRPVRGALAYATAKAAVEGLTRALAVDYGPLGIRVNAVALGSVETERSVAARAGQDEAIVARTQEEIRLLHPLGRMGTGPEVAAVVAFLLSDAASFVSGAVVPVDGGRAALGRDPEEVVIG